MRKRLVVTISTIFLIAGLSIVAWTLTVVPYSEATIYATNPDDSFTGRVQWWRLERLNDCPRESFEPETPIGLVANGYGMPHADKEKTLDLLTLLLQKGCDINERSAWGNTALHLAVISGEEELVNYLLQHGADPHLKYEYREVPGYTHNKSDLHGLDSIELAELMYEKRADNKSMLYQLQRYQNKT